jgi:hypothetical protein
MVLTGGGAVTHDGLDAQPDGLLRHASARKVRFG